MPALRPQRLPAVLSAHTAVLPAVHRTQARACANGSAAATGVRARRRQSHQAEPSPPHAIDLLGIPTNITDDIESV